MRRCVPAAVLAAMVTLAGCTSSTGGTSSSDSSSAPVRSVDVPSSTVRSTVPAPVSRTASRTVGPAGGPSSPVAAGGRITDACTLLPRPEAQALVRTSIIRVQKQPVGPFVTCGYYGRALAPLVQVQVSANEYTRAQFERTAKGEEDVAGDAVALRGIGDLAYGFHETPGYVVVLKGSTFFQIVAGGTPDDAATARSAAVRVAARL